MFLIVISSFLYFPCICACSLGGVVRQEIALLLGELMLVSELPTVKDFDFFDWKVLLACLDFLSLCENVPPVDNSSEEGMFLVKMWRVSICDEELGVVRVFSSVCHR